MFPSIGKPTEKHQWPSDGLSQILTYSLGIFGISFAFDGHVQFIYILYVEKICTNGRLNKDPSIVYFLISAWLKLVKVVHDLT